MQRPLNDLIANLRVLELRGGSSVAINGLAYDSRDVRDGFLFFALPGLHSDGHDYVESAIERGAAAIVHSRELAEYRDGICYIRVEDPRFAMAPVASSFWNRPSASMGLIGVTGTEGKSTCVLLVCRLLELAGRKAGFISTVEHKTGERAIPNPKHQTTPEAPVVQELIAAMRENGFEYAVIESSSHGLSPRTNRLGELLFDVGIMTNVRHEHLEFHGSWEQYRDDKANLFRFLDAHDHVKERAGVKASVPSFGVTCVDDESADYFRAVTAKPVYTYSMKSPHAADLWAEDIRSDGLGSDFRICDAYGSRWEARINLPGDFNVENALAALLTVHKLTGMGISELAPLLPALEPVRGRMTRIDAGQPFELLVDYAHTPSSFETVLPPLKARIAGKLICVFGSGGERDVQKRPAQGKIAAESCGVVILSDEDPRAEDPMAILEDIAAGCAGLKRGDSLYLIPDRALAIRKAISLAKPGDAVVLLGKGHESTIDYATGSIPWDEIDEARQALAEAGFKPADRAGGKA